ncbi:MAG: WXG100 family type VII secretion target [Actinobacteria bacterium]|nr:MAG: WXG100 family type VII secretion target [Actinomycetota bacterium]
MGAQDKRNGVTCMASNQTQTDHALMEQTAKNFETVNSDLMSTLDRLKRSVSELQGGWAGQGAMSFQSTMETWSKDQTNINNLLAQTASLIRSGGQNYAAVDASTSARFNNQGGAAPLPGV